MAQRPLKPCKHTGCPNLSHDTYCEQHRQNKRSYDKDRGTAAQRGYNSRWRKARTYYLKHNPSCAKCGALATVVDHMQPHKGNYELFWNQDNWQPLCKPCHDRKTRTEDMGKW